MAQLSTMYSFAATRPAYSFAMVRPTSRNSPLAIRRMFALWTMLTCFRPWRTAYSKAYRMIRSQENRVTIAWDTPTAWGSSPTRMKCSTPE